MFKKWRRRKRKEKIFKAILEQGENFNPDEMLKTLDDLEIVSEIADELVELNAKIDLIQKFQKQ